MIEEMCCAFQRRQKQMTLLDRGFREAGNDEIVMLNLAKEDEERSRFDFAGDKVWSRSKVYLTAELFRA